MQGNYWTSRLLQRRLTRRRALAAASTFAAGAALLSACGGGDDESKGSGPVDTSGLVAPIQDTSKQAKRGGVLKFPVTADVTHFDLHLAVPGVENPQFHVYDRLIQPKPGHMQEWEGDFEGDLAESWEWSPDKLQLTLRLRQNVKWHNKPPVNGRLFDIEDVVTSWERFLARGNAGAIANQKNPNAPILSLTAADSKTVVVKLKQPVANLLAILAQPRTSYIIMFPKEIDKTWDVRQDMLGTGPFMLTSYQQGVGYKFKRNPDYFDSEKRPYIEEVEIPVIPEYAQLLAQLKAGNIHTTAAVSDIRPEDILPTKRDIPKLNMFANRVLVGADGTLTAFGWQARSGKSPFLDERVRQAYSMALDRDLWINTFYNADKFKAEGLPIETRWNTHLQADLDGWWLDPREKDFGANAKYFEYNVAEAKRLLAAAGYSNGLDTVSHVPAAAFGPNYPRKAQVQDNMAAEAGFRAATDAVANYPGEFVPKYRDSAGNFEGWSTKLTPSYAVDALAYLMRWFYSKGGIYSLGLDAQGNGDNSGDPQLDAQFEKALGELDTEKRRAMVFDIQRYLAKPMYAVMWPGAANSFFLVAPEIQNWNVFRWPDLLQSRFVWVDETKRS